MKKLALIAPAGALLLASQVLAQEDAAVEQFRTAYTAGSGIAYVVVPEGNGERVYRYGDKSRAAAKKDKRGFIVFTCATPRVFVTDRATDKAALAKAKVVQPGDPGFAALDAKYVAGCRNPFVKSAVPKTDAKAEPKAEPKADAKPAPKAK